MDPASSTEEKGSGDYIADLITTPVREKPQIYCSVMAPK